MRQRKPDTQDAAKPRDRGHKREEGDDLKHIIETGLPPGISEDEAKDPGSQTPRNPADDRS